MAQAPLGAQERLLEAQRLMEQLRVLDAAIREAEARLRELGEAEKLLERFGRGRSVYRSVGGLMVEVGYEEAKRMIEEERELLEARLASLKRQREELERRLRELLRSLGLA